MSDEVIVTPHEELCDQALEHYDNVSKTASSWNSLIPKAIEYYKRWSPRGERKIVNTKGKLEEALNEGWTFDPWLNSRGNPIPISEAEIYWVLVRGTPEQIAAMNPITELPEDEIDEGPEDVDPYALRTDFIPFDTKEGETREPKPGYVVMHKDHVYAKGTAYTLPPKPVSVWTLAIQLAGLSSHLGVAEAHDVIQGILKQEATPV